VYPVISRRSGGLSLGINLFPQAKICSFDCPYCEVFGDLGIDRRRGDVLAEELEEELEDFLGRAYPEFWEPEPLRDLCISGNGEPTASPLLETALELCAGFRRSRPELLGRAELVLITNSTGFLDAGICALLERFCRDEGLVIWAKLDAGSEGLFRSMSGLQTGSGLSLERVAGGLLSFARSSSLVVQTMLCELEGRSPTEAEVEDYAGLLAGLVAGGARISQVHLYTLARPSPAGTCAALPDGTLLRHAALVRRRTGLPVRVFGSGAEIG
jgi:histidinol dehydrogenase